MLLGLVVAQKFGGKPAERLKPGAERNDVVLTNDVTAHQVGPWTKKGFQPAPDPKTLPKGQYWWVHQWSYQTPQNSAIVSCDQLGETQWHELTFCYRNQGCRILERTVLEEEPGMGPFAVAKLQKSDGEESLLVFSVFFEDGSWARPPEVNLPRLNQKTTMDYNAGDRLFQKFDPAAWFADPQTGHERAIQCQVLLTGPDCHREATIQEAITLHLATRESFRTAWNQHWKK